DPRCVDARDRMASLWNPSRRAAVRQAFEGTGSRLAVISEDRTSAALDAFSARWQTAFRRVCGARRLVEPGDRPLEPAVRCLDQAAEHAGALVDLLLHADPSLVESAPRAALDLPRPGECAGALSPGRAARPAADPKQLAELRRR